MSRVRRLLSAVPPSHPRQSVEIRLLEALIQAAAVNDWGIMRSAILREEARLLGQLNPAMATLRRVGVQPAAKLLAAFGTGHPIDAILGWHDEQDEFHPGLARLAPQESRAWTHKLSGATEREIATYLDRRRPSRRLDQLGLPSISVAAVHQYIERGRRKLLALFREVRLKEAS